VIVDFHANLAHALLYDIVDAATGGPMADQSIFYADDATGLYRFYPRDAKGNFHVDPAEPSEAAWLERRGNFRLVLKAQAGAAPGADRPETWRDRKSLL
jgi:hypothetical protein